MQSPLRLSLPAGSQFSNIARWTPTSFIVAAINLIMVFAVVAFIFQILLGGLKFIFAGGEKEATQKATRGMMNAFIGLLIVFGSYAVMHFMENFLGIPLLYFRILPVS